MANDKLSKARSEKNDEFYTQFADIEREMNAYLELDPDAFRDKTVLLPCDDPEWSNFTKYFAQNFERLGLRKLISTSYAPDSRQVNMISQPTLFESASPQFDPAKTTANGKIFTLTSDKSGDGRIDVDDLEWDYLQGDGDFRSDEIRRLRDEADVVVTNPPFSLFREFLAWILEADKQFVIIGSMNAITYKEVFPVIMADKMWLGNGFQAGNAYFRPLAEREYAAGVYDDKTKLVKFRNVVWFANIDHGRRHEPLALMTVADNKKFSRHKEVKGIGYKKFDNYDAINVPYIDAIPSDYPGAMGVPISFLSKHNPEQFEILGITDRGDEYGLKTKEYKKGGGVPKPGDLNRRAAIKLPDGTYKATYARLLIRHRKAS